MIIYPVYSYTVTENPYLEAFFEHLEVGPAAYLKLNAHGKSAESIDKSLAELYQDNEYKPFWIKEGGPGKRAAAILATLEDAGSHGLDPASYFTDKVHEYWKSTDVTGLVRLDILLSLGMMRYVADQREGRIEPREIDPKLFDTARDVEVDWGPLMKAAFRATHCYFTMVAMEDGKPKAIPPYKPETEDEKLRDQSTKIRKQLKDEYIKKLASLEEVSIL